MNPIIKHKYSVLTVAPMSFSPPRDGASVRIHGIAEAFAEHGVANTLVGSDYLLTSDGQSRSLSASPGLRLGRSLTGLRALLRFGHYNEVKLCTPGWRRRFLGAVSLNGFDCIYINYLFAYPFLEDVLRGRRIIIDTANSEWQWFERFAENTLNPLVKLLCYSSCRRADQIMEGLPAGTVMVHCSPSDLEDYRVRRPDLTHLLVPSGCHVSLRSRSPDYSATKKNLLFFGNLSGKMNCDALLYFRERFWPTLKDLATVIVAGSSPSRQVARICEANGWQLRADVPSEQVPNLFEDAHYAIMPFRYGVGSKLKLLDSCSRGIPTLTTRAGACGQIDLPSSVIITDSPEDWRSTIARTDPDGGLSREALLDFNRRNCWANVVGPLVNLIRGRHEISV